MGFGRTSFRVHYLSNGGGGSREPPCPISTRVPSFVVVAIQDY